MFQGILRFLGLAADPDSALVPTDATFLYPEHERPEIVNMVPADAVLVLDIGCATGALGLALKRSLPRAHVIGVEKDQRAARVARSRLDEVLCLDLDSLTERQIPGRYDVIICADVIEHLRDPERFLNLLAGLLTPDGCLILSVPNVRHWSVLGPLLVDDLFTYTDQGLLDRTHLHLFTRTELCRMLERSGWSLCELQSIEIPMPEELQPILDCIGSLGGDVTRSQSLMNAFQFLIRAVRAG